MKGPFVAAGIVIAVLTAGCSATSSPLRPSSSQGGDASSEARGAIVHPLKGDFEGTATVTPTGPTSANVHVVASGQATVLGRFGLDLPHSVDFVTSMASGTCTLTAANGDVLTATFTGQAQPGPVVSIEEHATITGGTGRFAGATGTFVLHREFTPATGIVTGTIEGTIRIAKTKAGQ